MVNIRKKLLIRFSEVLVISLLVLQSFSVFAAEEKNEYLINISYSFDKPLLKDVTIGESSYTRVIMRDTESIGDSGMPVLPVKEAKILIPYEQKVSDIIVTPGKQVFLDSDLTIEPGSEAVPMIQIKSRPQTVPNKDIYSSESMYPGNIITEIGTYGFRGYQILVLSLHPVQYIPLTGELYYYLTIQISIKTVKDIGKPINSLFRGFIEDESEIRSKIDNPEIINSYPESVTGSHDDYDLLILTTDLFKTDFNSLAEVHNLTGISTVIKTLADVGSDDPEEIRTFIREAYLNLGINYVLIGGDQDIIPARILWVSNGFGASTEMPSDLYYACLDGPYNYDGDERWGETRDGEDGGDVDLVAEVYIGRAPVGNSEEIDHFIHKTVSYIFSNHTYLDETLMVGEHLLDNPLTWGGDHMDELIDGSSSNGYTTIGFGSTDFIIDTLYDRDWIDNNWPKSEIINRINDDVHIINHLGHSWYNYNMKMVNEDVFYLSNDKYCFIYSQGCDNGGFDDPYGYDCIGEYFTVKTDHAAFAVVMNARSGWFNPGTTKGPSHRYHREFWDAVFNESMTEISRANQDSKEDNLYIIRSSCMRWCYYQLNLLGDPTIDFFKHIDNRGPANPGTPIGPTEGEVGVEYSYNINSIMDPEGDKTYYKFYWGDGETSRWLGPFQPGKEVTASHIYSLCKNYEIRVKCRDTWWGLSDFSEPLIVSIEGPFLEIGKIKGGLFKASAEIRNIGAGYATNVKRSISVKGVNNDIYYVTNSTIDILESHETTIARTDKLLKGFGNVIVTATTSAPGIEKVSKTINGYLLFYYLLII